MSSFSKIFCPPIQRFSKAFKSSYSLPKRSALNKCTKPHNVYEQNEAILLITYSFVFLFLDSLSSSLFH